MSEIDISLEQLRTLIGRQVHHHGVACQIIEVLEDGPVLVLQDGEMHTHLQPDQFGEAHRRVVQTYSVPVYTADHSGYHPDFLVLELFD